MFRLRKAPYYYRGYLRGPKNRWNWLGLITEMLSLFFVVICMLHGIKPDPKMTVLIPYLAPFIVVGFAISAACYWRKSLFGLDVIKLGTFNNKLILNLERNKGLLDSVGYHHHYSRVSVDKVLKDLSITNLGLREQIDDFKKLLLSAEHLTVSYESLRNENANNKSLNGVSKAELQRLYKEVTKTRNQIQQSESKLINLISKRTLDALKANKQFFTIDDQQKINSTYIQNAVQRKIW